MTASVLLFTLLLNVYSHGNLIVGILNSVLLFFSIYLHSRYRSQEFYLFRFPKSNSHLGILIAAMPIFSRSNDILTLLLAIGLCLLLYLCGWQCKSERSHKIFLIILTAVYLIVASLLSTRLIKIPFTVDYNQLIINDDWIIYYINKMRAESLYLPYNLRFIIFSPSIILYVILQKIANIFSLENLYQSLLLVNIYPLIVGSAISLKRWTRINTLMVLYMFVILITTAVARNVDVPKTFILLSPLLMYIVLEGLNKVDKRIYLALFIVSIIFAFQP